MQTAVTVAEAGSAAGTCGERIISSSHTLFELELRSQPLDIGLGRLVLLPDPSDVVIDSDL